MKNQMPSTEFPEEPEKPLFSKKDIKMILIGIIIIIGLASVFLYYFKPSLPTTTTTTTTTIITTTTTTLPPVAFSDSFDEFDLGENWEIGGNWEVVESDEAYSPPNVLRADAGRIFTIQGGEGSWEDYIVEVKGKLLIAELGYGLAFRVQKTEDFYKFYSCQYDPGGGGIFLTKKGEGEIILESVEFDTDTEWHTLKVEVIGNEFKCYVDGELAITATDDEFTQGKIGMEVWGTESYFDDVIVRLV